jgi:N-methylhydantoinase B
MCLLAESDGEDHSLPSKVTRAVEPGSRLISVTPGGGGRGDPLRRKPEAVLRDVAEGLVSPERARSEYGVAIGPETLELDEVATEQLRAARADVPAATRKE